MAMTIVNGGISFCKMHMLLFAHRVFRVDDNGQAGSYANLMKVIKEVCINQYFMHMTAWNGYDLTGNPCKPVVVPVVIFLRQFCTS
jgi:hypothetical protein